MGRTRVLFGLVLIGSFVIGRHPVSAAVLIAGSPADGSWLSDVQSKIVGTGLISGSVDTFDLNAATPTLAQLQSYKAVLVFTDYQALDSAALGNVLSDYVDGGGGVVQATFAFSNELSIGGRWQTGNYSVFQLGDQSESVVLTLGTIYDAGNPILNGVSSFNGGNSSYYNTFPGMRAGAIRVADWSNGVPLIGTDVTSFNGRVAGLNFYPPSSDSRSDFWNSTTDGGLIMANSLNYVAVPEPSTFVLAVLAFGLLYAKSPRR
jgi:hypothetical protein